MNNDPHYGEEAYLSSLDETSGPFDIDLTEQANGTKTPNQITAEYLCVRGLELGQGDYPKLPHSEWAKQYGDENPGYAYYWLWVASQLTSYTAIVHCLVDRDPVRHSIRFIEALNVDHALEIALEDEIQERKAYPIQRDGGYKPEHFRVVAIFEGNIAHSYFNFN